MDSIRQQKISQLLKRELAQIFQTTSQGHFSGQLITVTQLRVSPDLGSARVYVSFLHSGKDSSVLELVKDKTSFIRRELGLRVGKQIRKIPELTFFVDDSLDYFEEIDRLLKK